MTTQSLPSTCPSCAPQDSRIAFFNHHAHTWDHDTGNQSNTIHRLNHMKETLGIHAGLRILEIGCGTGSITKWLAQCIGPNHVLAVDFSSTMLEKAKAKGIPARFL
jgi:ubiquinone/menaquinone biosynthesis C-methylase UbiE